MRRALGRCLDDFAVLAMGAAQVRLPRPHPKWSCAAPGDEGRELWRASFEGAALHRRGVNALVEGFPGVLEVRRAPPSRAEEVAVRATGTGGQPAAPHRPLHCGFKRSVKLE